MEPEPIQSNDFFCRARSFNIEADGVKNDAQRAFTLYKSAADHVMTGIEMMLEQMQLVNVNEKHGGTDEHVVKALRVCEQLRNVDKYLVASDWRDWLTCVLGLFVSQRITLSSCVRLLL